jgi:hypothetical protein
VSFTDFIAAQPTGAPDVQIHADGIWEILFTSGSMALPNLNAAQNILALGRRERQNACGDGVRPPLAVAAVSETGTRRGAA